MMVAKSVSMDLEDLTEIEKRIKKLVPGRKKRTIRKLSSMDGTTFWSSAKIPWGEKTSGSASQSAIKNTRIIRNCANPELMSDKTEMSIIIGIETAIKSATKIRKKIRICAYCEINLFQSKLSGSAWENLEMLLK